MSSRFLFPATLATLVLATPAAVVAQPVDSRLASQIQPGNGLTSDEVARRSRGTSPELAARQQEIAAAQAAVDQARAAYIPQLTGTARYTRISAIDQPEDLPFPIEVLQNQTEFEARLTVPLSDFLLRVPHATASARHAARAAGETAAATARDVEIEGRDLYYDWVRARLQTIVFEQSLETARSHLEDSKKAFAVGTSSKADVLQVESSVAQNELVLQRTRHLAELHEGRLRIAMHDTTGAPYIIGEDVLAELPAAAQNAEALAAQAIDRREELRAFTFNAESLRERADLSRAGYFPRLDLVAGAQYANPNPRAFPQTDEFSSSWDVTVQLSWTPTDIPASRAAARESEHRADALAAQRNQAADAIRVEVLAAVQSVKDAVSSIEASAKTIVTAEEAHRVRRALFQNGRATSLELSDAELELTRARFENVNARVDLRVALARLERAIAAR